MELSTVTMLPSLNYFWDIPTTASDYSDALLLYSNQSFNNGTKVYSFSLVSIEVRRLLFVVILPILMVFGTYGNVVSFYIMQSGSLKEVSTCFYMAMLGIADTIVLWSGCLSAFFFHATYSKVNLFNWLECKLFQFLVPFSSELSSCLLAVMCIEKCFALYFPLKTRSICTVAMAKRATFVVSLILAAFNIQSFFIFEVYVGPHGYEGCYVINTTEHYAWIRLKIETILYSFAPFTIMVLTNLAIIYKFMRASCARDQGGTESTNQALSKSANKGTAMLITVSLTFLILTGPVAFVDLNIRQLDPIFVDVFVIMRYTNHSINAVLYCVSGSRFRNELMKIFPFRLCRKVTNNQQSGSQSVSSVTRNSSSATVMSNVSVRARQK